MNNEVIISCAITGSGDTAKKHPNLPITPKEIAEAAIEAGKAGAAIAHMHVREPDGKPSRKLQYYKEVADRIVAKFNTPNYGRLTILSNWKLNIKKICDIKPECFSPKPKVESTLLLFVPKKKFFKIKDPKNLEKITRVFFNQRRKMLKKPFNQIFNGDQRISNKLKIDLNLRPQNLDFDTYYQLTSEYENLGS